MLQATALILTLALALFGWGGLVRRVLCAPARSQPVPMRWDDGVLGLVAAAAFGATAHLLVPLSGGLCAAWTLAGLGLWCLAAVPVLSRRPRMAAAAWLTLLVLALGASSVSAGLNKDAALYHLQALQWAHREPIVLGLTHLHHRLGYNSLWLMNIALLRLPGVELDGVLVGNHVAALVVLSWLCGGLLESDRQPLRVAAAVVAAPVVLVMMRESYNLANWPSTDGIATLLWVTLASMFLQATAPNLDGTERAYRLGLMWLLATYALGVKLSLAPVFLLPLAASIQRWRAGHGIGLSPRMAGSAFGLLALTGVRHVLVSGCLYYPFAPSCGLPVPWSVGAAAAALDTAEIRTWARAPHSPPMPFWQWDWVGQGWLDLVGVWAVRLSCATAVASLVLALCTDSRGVRAALRTRRPPACAWSLATLALVCGLGALFWLAGAPGPRFGEGVFVTLGLLPGMGLLGWGQERGVTGAAVRRALALIGTVAVAVTCTGLYDRGNWLAFGAHGWLRTGALQMLVVPELQSRRMGRVRVSVPTYRGECWLAEPPCAPKAEVPIDARRVASHWIVYSAAAGAPLDDQAN